jgi:hypothetical protein
MEIKTFQDGSSNIRYGNRDYPIWKLKKAIWNFEMVIKKTIVISISN